MPEKISAGRLLNSLQETFGFKKRKPPEVAVPAGAAEPAPVVPSQPAAIEAPTPLAETPASEAPATQLSAEDLAPIPASELPVWLRGGEQEAVTPTPSAPVDTSWLEGGRAAAEELWPSAPAAVEAPALAPAPEAPVAPESMTPTPVSEAPPELPTAEAEKTPEQLAIEQFETALLKADGTLMKLLGKQSLKKEELREAMGAAATANGLIRSLPERYLRVLLASRRLGDQREYTRMDFQEAMGGAIKYFMMAQKG